MDRDQNDATMTSPPSDLLADLAAQAPGLKVLCAAPGEVLFRPNDACRGFIALRAGAIRVTLGSASGREIVLYRVRPGEICLQTFSCLLRDLPYGAEGVAEEAVEALIIPPPAFDALMADNPHFRAAVLASVAGRFADFEHVVETLAFTGLEARVAEAVLRLAQDGLEARVTHEALAAEIGSAREAVSRQLGLFVRQGLVDLGRGRIVIKRRGALARLVQGAV